MTKRKVQRSFDAGLMVALALLMASARIGQAAHEWLGIGMAALFVAHHILNRRWHAALFRGRYTSYRAVLTTIDVLLAVVFATQIVSGLAMARGPLRGLLNVSWGSKARIVHLLGAYWGFALCGLHAGMHLTGALRRWRRAHGIGKIAVALAVGVACGWGVWAFVRRGWGDYMTLRTQFAFVDYKEPMWRFLVDAVAMLAAYMGLGCALAFVLQKK